MLRRAAPEDLEELYLIEVECFRQRRFRRDHVDWILRNPRALTLVEEDRSRLLGSAMVLFDGHVARVLSVAVVADARRSGIGTRLMHAAEEVARERWCSIVQLEVSTQNLGAIAFYRGLGYVSDGLLPGYYSWGEDAYSMRKAVLPSQDAAAENLAWDGVS